MVDTYQLRLTKDQGLRGTKWTVRIDAITFQNRFIDAVNTSFQHKITNTTLHNVLAHSLLMQIVFGMYFYTCVTHLYEKQQCSSSSSSSGMTSCYQSR